MMETIQVLIFAGTTEGRQLAELLADAGIGCSVCVATEYAQELMNTDGLTVHCGRLTEEEMRTLIRTEQPRVVVDATHPYAAIVSENIKKAAREAQTVLIRLRRNTDSGEQGIRTFPTHESCSRWLEQQEGNILLTTGSKDLGTYAGKELLRSRLYVRVLPSEESIRLCREQGLTGRQIIAMQGPFSRQMNERMLEEYAIDWMVTKQSGRAGGFEEKIEAAKHCQVGICVILPPSEEAARQNKEKQQETETAVCVCESVCDTAEKLEKMLGREIRSARRRHIVLAGIGMGNPDSMTRESYRTFEEAQVIFGAARMLEGLPGRAEKVPYYRAADIIPYLQAHPEYTDAAVAFSGDSGYYSGAQAMKQALDLAEQSGSLKADTVILPGISSVSALAARLGVSWEDAVLESIHGRKKDILRLVREHSKVFLLTSGKEDLELLSEKLCQAGCSSAIIYAGYRLSYPEERVVRFTPGEPPEDCPQGLYTCLIVNPDAKAPVLTPGLEDESFARTKVPMTKKEVRVLSVSQLQLTKNAVVYDVGSGTGSVTAECARLSPDIRVFALEQKEEAAELTQENVGRLGLENVTVIHGKAPEAFDGLEAPTHVFIGGSSGLLCDILSALQKKIAGKYEKVRVVVNAVSLETIAEVTKAVKEYPTEQVQLVQVQASRAKELGRYHLMQAENPVLIASFDLLSLQEP